MVDTSMLRVCNHCGQEGPKKDHNGDYLYCERCKRDENGEKVSVCGHCGVVEPESRMETRTMCSACWQADVAEFGQGCSQEDLNRSSPGIVSGLLLSIGSPQRHRNFLLSSGLTAELLIIHEKTLML